METIIDSPLNKNFSFFLAGYINDLRLCIQGFLHGNDLIQAINFNTRCYIVKCVLLL